LLPSSFFPFFFSLSAPHRDLPSFPTRRSSDLFQPDHVLTAQVALPPSAYTDLGRRFSFYEALVARLGALPGVEGAALSSGVLGLDRKSTRLNSSHVAISYAVFCLKKKNT